jgi:hypothetical protein
MYPSCALPQILSKYNLFLPAFLDNCTNHAYKLAIVIYISSHSLVMNLRLRTLYDHCAYHLSTLAIRVKDKLLTSVNESED